MNETFKIILLLIIISCLVYLIITKNKHENENFVDTICHDKINLALQKAKKKYDTNHTSGFGVGIMFEYLDENSKAQLEIIELIEIFREGSSHSAILFHNILDCYKQHGSPLRSKVPREKPHGFYLR